MRVIVTPAVYPRLFECHHFDIQSIGQKSHCVKTFWSHRNAIFFWFHWAAIALRQKWNVFWKHNNRNVPKKCYQGSLMVIGLHWFSLHFIKADWSSCNHIGQQSQCFKIVKKTNKRPPNPTPAPPHPKLSNYEGCIKVAAFIIGELRNLDDKNNN